MTPIRCVFLAPTDRVEESLRRYASGAKCSASGYSYHDAEVVIGRRRRRRGDASIADAAPSDDRRWPQRCACGYEFAAADTWQRNVHHLYRPSDGGPLLTLRAAPVGAMWFATWMSDVEEWRGPDGQTLVVRLPLRHDWIVDSRASNCDSPCVNCAQPYHVHLGGACPGAEERVKAGTYDRAVHAYRDARPHKCWCRHGEPPDVHVDKVGVTCNAGAGSIAYAGFHGFLHHGQVVSS